MSAKVGFYYKKNPGSRCCFLKISFMEPGIAFSISLDQNLFNFFNLR